MSVERPVLSGQALLGLEAEWRELESRSAGSFFQSWSWVGCRVAERFTSPVLIRASEGGTTTGLALFNRRSLPFAPRALWLHQTGDAAEDSVFVEMNGPLVADGHRAASRAILAAALRRSGAVILNGIEDDVFGAVAGLGRVDVRARREAPFSALPGEDAGQWSAALGASTRAQLARSRRWLEAVGPLAIRQPSGVPEALAFLGRLADLHQRSWTARGQPGAFAEPAFRHFHEQLVRTAYPRGEVELWEVTLGVTPLGYLYNFRWNGRIVSYQSGFDTTLVPRASPGLVSHSATVVTAIQNGVKCYDFLAGDSRYKRELSNTSRPVYWVELTSMVHPRASYNFVRGELSRSKRRLSSLLQQNRR